MKLKRLAALTATLVVLGAGIVYASSPWGDYQGYDKVRVLINNEEVSTGDVPAFMIDGRVVLPLRELADSLQTIVNWDESSKTAYMYKPNVHMFVAKELAKDDSPKTPFGKVSKGNKLDFVVTAQVDSLTTPIQSFKIDLVSPEGAIIRTTNAVTLQDSQDSFWYSWPLEGVSFDSVGTYKVQFKIKLDDVHDYSIASEKTITSG